MAVIYLRLQTWGGMVVSSDRTAMILVWVLGAMLSIGRRVDVVALRSWTRSCDRLRRRRDDS